MNAPPPLQKAARLWQRLPFRHMMAIVVILYIFGKKQPFPLSNFPMYSGISEEADVYFATDQADRPLAMDRVFDTGSSNTKKLFKTKLSSLLSETSAKSGEPRRDTEDATEAERATVGKDTLDTLVRSMKQGNLPPGTTAVRLYSRTFSLADSDTIQDQAPKLLAEHPLSPPAP